MVWEETIIFLPKEVRLEDCRLYCLAGANPLQTVLLAGGRCFA